VPRSTRKLDELAALLERTGGDPRRIEAVRRAQGFRRSWVDLAEALFTIRRSTAWQDWGFEDFYDYCSRELTLKRVTVDKLTVSFATLSRHAPSVLEHDGIARSVPTYDAVSYFQRAIGDDDAANDAGIVRRSPAPRAASAELTEEFHRAVFDEGQPIAELRRRFDDKFFPRPKGQDRLDAIKRASAHARKLIELLPDIDGLSDKRVRGLELELGRLRNELGELAEPLQERVSKAKQRAYRGVAQADGESDAAAASERAPRLPPRKSPPAE
jgi:hypothetical protein